MISNEYAAVYRWSFVSVVIGPNVDMPHSFFLFPRMAGINGIITPPTNTNNSVGLILGTNPNMIAPPEKVVINTSSTRCLGVVLDVYR